MNESKLIKEKIVPILMQYDYSIEKFEPGYYEFVNPHNMTYILITRGPRKEYYRISYFLYNEGFSYYSFGINQMDPQYGYEADMRYQSIDELSFILNQYLEVTINLAIPIISRVFFIPNDVFNNMYMSLAEDTHVKSLEWATENNVENVYSPENIILIQNYIDKLRSNDCTYENFISNSHKIILASAYLGEILVQKEDINWIWDSSTSSGKVNKSYILSTAITSNGFIAFDALRTVIDYWIFTPELYVYKIEQQCAALFRQFGHNV
jgi:hypothetical protein